jgi:O-antigen ligase
MARRKEKERFNPKPDQPVEPSLTPGQELFRRVLLGLVTALIVARPLVPTEDPGLSAAMPDPSGPALTWLWLVAFLGWALWQFWVKPAGVRFDLLEAALLALLALNLLGVRTARYRYVAWLGAWEWLTFFIAFFVVRRLAAWKGTSDGLLAALLASAVMLSGYAAYQRFVEYPQRAEKTLPELQAEMPAEGFAHSADDQYWEGIKQRARSPSVFATFAHPNSFAGFLGLLLPAALAYVFAMRRSGGWDALTILAIISAALIAAAFWWTDSRGALMAALIVTVAIIVLAIRRLLSRGNLRSIAGCLVLVLALAVLGYVGLQKKTVGQDPPRVAASLQKGYWAATWKMIKYQGWLGVGPGNFGRHYPAYMAPTDRDDIQNPHNFLLEMWATCGFFAAAMLVFVLGLCARRAWVYLRSSPVSVPGLVAGQGQGHGKPAGTPWELYLGGMAGLVLGFLLTFSADDLVFPADSSATDRFFIFIYKYHAALVRSIIWFPALGLFLSVRFSDSARTKALLAGLAVLLLNLCVSDGITLPAVALPFWISLALVIAACDAGNARAGRRPGSASQFGFLLRVLPIPVSALLVLIYGGTYWLPTAEGARQFRKMVHSSQELAEAISDSPGLVAISEDRAKEIRTHRIGFIQANILKPLEIASSANPGDARYPRLQATWQGVIWQMLRGGKLRDKVQEDALKLVEKSQTLDPVDRENWLAEAKLDAIFARRLQLESWLPTLAVSWPWGPFFNLQLPPQPLGVWARHFNVPAVRAGGAAQSVWSDEAKALAEAVKLGPTQLRIRYELVVAHRFAGKDREAREEAVDLLRSNRDAHPTRKLPIEQREQLRHWLDARSAR